MPLLTIITPTYNRVHCLRACWESLCAQTSRDFQWLVIDDGSTDATRQLIEQCSLESPWMDLEYHYKENGGKHTALNEAHPYIRGKFIVILDSDDTLTANAVEAILNAWTRFEAEPAVGRVIFLKGYSKDQPICYVKNEGSPVDTLREPRIGKTGRDCCDTFRKELFCAHPFPVFPGERFIGEGAAFFGMELESKGVYYNEVLYLCDYSADGLTKAGRKMRLQNPLGGMYNSRVYMHPRLPMKTRLKKAMLYAAYSRFAHCRFPEALAQNPYKSLTLLTFLPGLCLAGYWKKKYLR